MTSQWDQGDDASTETQKLTAALEGAAWLVLWTATA